MTIFFFDDDNDDDDDDDDNDELLLRNGWPKNGVRLYFQPQALL